MTHNQGTAIIILILVALGFPFFSFFKPPQTWEYKHVTIKALPNVSRIGQDAMSYTSVKFYGSELDSMGKSGWELAGSFLEMETAYPNFGKSDYVTGLQPNVRPQCLVLIFKRPKSIFSVFRN